MLWPDSFVVGSSALGRKQQLQWIDKQHAVVHKSQEAESGCSGCEALSSVHPCVVLRMRAFHVARPRRAPGAVRAGAQRREWDELPPAESRVSRTRVL